MNNKKTLVDLFAGCGGLSLGLEQAGFFPVFVNEIENSYIETYKFNHNIPLENYFVGDINVLNENIERFSNFLSNIDLVCGGPPCQGFSMANRQRIINDPRNQLYKAYLFFLSRIRPKFFVLENVKGMINKTDELLSDFQEYLGEDYIFDFAVLNAQDYGIPQNRERFILIGNRINIDLTKVFSDIYSHKRVNYCLKDAIFGLPHLESKKEKNKNNVENSQSGFTEIEFCYPKTDYYNFINDYRHIDILYNHKNRYNNERDIEIYRRLPQGANSLHESIADIMPYKSRNGIFKDKYFKLNENAVCKTITSHMKYDCNMYIHPWESRGLSPREAARIQTFPDDYVFKGTQNSWYAQIGNAVPVKLAEIIGKSIIKYL